MKTVLCHGVFDVVHAGHIRLLKYARSLGDELVVSLLADKWVREYKGTERPIHSLAMRTEHLLELRCVDRTVVVDGPGHEAVQGMIAEVRPLVYVKGEAARGTFGEEEFVRTMGIAMVFMPMVGEFSTTALCG